MVTEEYRRRSRFAVEGADRDGFVCDNLVEGIRPVPCSVIFPLDLPATG